MATGLDQAPRGATRIERWFRGFAAGLHLGDGLDMDGNLMVVDLATVSGLEFASGQLRIDADGARGTAIDATGLYIQIASDGAIIFNGSGELAAQVGNGIEIASNALAVDLASGSGFVFTTGELDSSAGGDLSGQLGSAEVVGIRGTSVRDETPSVNGQRLAYSSGSGDWHLVAAPTIPPGTEYDDGALITLTSDTSGIATGYNALPWDNQEFVDSRFSHDTGTNPSEITIETGERIYIDVDVSAEISTGTGTQLNGLLVDLQLNHSGGGFATLTDSVGFATLLRVSGTPFAAEAHISYAIQKADLADGDIIRVRVAKQTGANTVIIKGTGTRIRIRTEADGST